jgi:hypothetical protein
MSFTKIASAGISSTGSFILQNVNSSGVSTFGNTVVGGATTELVVTGDARITGILTIGTSSVTLDGTNNQVNVGTGVTIHHTNGVQVGGNTVHSTGLTINQINVGTGASTGTASQTLQVTGGAYVSGNLGIGVTNPSSLLDVRSSASDSGISLGRPGSTATISLNNNGGQNSGRLIIRHNNSAVIEFRADGNGSYINTGAVGIGTANPTQTLHTVGTSLFNVTSTTSDGPFYIAGNKATTQGAIVHIRNDNVSAGDDVFGGLKFSSSPGADFIIGKSSRLGTGYLQVRRENGTQLLTVDGSGNVGILSATPGSTLDVYGSLSVGRTNNALYRYCTISNVGQIVTNVANNDNVSNLVIDNVGDLTSTTGHGSNILFRTSDNSSATAINSGQISVTKTQQWTSTASTRNSRLSISLASAGTVSDRILISSAGSTAQILCYKRSSSASEDNSLANHQFLFLEPDGDAPGYYRRSVASQYKGFNQYSYWAIRYDGASYDYTGSMKCRITWSTSHASGAGFAEFSLAVRSGDSDGGPAPAGNIIQYGAVQYSGGWFYGWSGNPDFDVYYAGFNENKQFLVLRLSGYMNHNGNTYDGGVHETVDLQSWGNAFQGIYRIGTSAPSGFTLNAVTKTILS